MGTIEPRKNYQLLIRAFNHVLKKTDLNLVILGKPGWLAEDICFEIKTHPDYGSRIHHLDQVPDAQLDVLYRNAWLSVIPSLYEGFGLPVIEALARGCPTICSTAGSLSEVGADNVNFFSPHSENELAVMIMKLSSDRAAYDQLRNAARDYRPSNWANTVADIDKSLSELY